MMAAEFAASEFRRSEKQCQKKTNIYIYIDRSIYLFWMMFAQYFQLGIFKIICYVDSSLCLYVCIEFLPIPIPNDVEGLASLVAEKLR